MYVYWKLVAWWWTRTKTPEMFPNIRWNQWQFGQKPRLYIHHQRGSDYWYAKKWECCGMHRWPSPTPPLPTLRDPPPPDPTAASSFVRVIESWWHGIEIVDISVQLLTILISLCPIPDFECNSSRLYALENVFLYAVIYNVCRTLMNLAASSTYIFQLIVSISTAFSELPL